MVVSSPSISALPPAADLLDVTTFGAVGNGITDDTVALQAAALAAAAAGKQLYFPAGTYVVSQALRMPSNTTWLAAPGTATLVTATGNPLVTAVLTQNDTLSGLDFAGSTAASNPSALVIGYKAQGLLLVNTAVQDTSGIGVLLSDVNNTSVVTSNFSNIGNSPAGLAQSTQGVAFTNDTAGYGSGNSVIGSSFSGIGLDAISATGQTGFQAVSNTITDGPINPGWGQLPAAAAGVYGSQDSGLVVADNSIQGVSGNGIDIVNSATVAVYQNTVTGSGGAGIGIFSDSFATVSWNTVLNNNVMAYYQNPGGIVVGAMNAANIVVAHNLSGNQGATASQLYGIQVLDPQDATSGTLAIAQDNVLTGNLSAAIASPAGSYALLSDSALPAMAYPVAVNDAPILGGVPASIATTGTAPVLPFAAATIAATDMGVTESLTVTVAGGGAAGTLSGPGVAATGTPGTYTVGTPGSTPAAAAAALQGVIFTPAAGAGPAGTVLSTALSVLDVQTSPTSSTPVSSTATTSITVSAAAAPITLSPSSGDPATTDQAPANPFANVVINDPNPSQTETALVTLSDAANGTLSDPNAGSDGGLLNNGTYAISGNAVAVAAALDALIFMPTAHQVGPGQSVTTGFTATITDTAGQSASIQSTVTAIAVAAPISATTAAASVATTDEAAAAPFSAVQISDPNAGQTETAVVTLGTLADGGLSETTAGPFGGSFNNGTYTVSGAAATVAAALDGLAFTPTPHQVAPGQTVTTTIQATITDTAGQQTAIGSTVVAQAVNDPPTISTPAGGTTSDAAPLHPLAGLTISDPDTGVIEAVTVVLMNTSLTATDADGTLSGAGLTQTGPGTYTLAGSAPAVTQALDSLVFTPTPHQVAPGQTVSTAIAVIADQNGTDVGADGWIQVNALNDAPVLGGLEADLVSAPGAAVQPFATATITDPDAGASVSLSLTLTDATGAASDAAGLLSGAGLTKTGAGSYVLDATSPAALSDELQALTFTPAAGTPAAGTGQAVAASFTLTARQAAGGTTTAATATLGVTISASGTIDGPASGSAMLVGNSGTDTIVAAGSGNTIVSNGGSGLILAGDGNAIVNAGGGDQTILLGGGANTVTGGNGDDTIFGSPDGSTTIRLGDGRDFVALGGTGNTIQLGDGNDVVVSGQGNTSVATGAGNSTIMLGGTGNTVLAGSGNTVIIDGSGSGNDTVNVPPAGEGQILWFNFTGTNGDVMNLRSALQATSWNQGAGTLSDYVSVTDTGASATLSISPSGSGGAAIPLVQLYGAAGLTLAGLLGNHVLDTGT